MASLATQYQGKGLTHRSLQFPYVSYTTNYFRGQNNTVGRATVYRQTPVGARNFIHDSADCSWGSQVQLVPGLIPVGKAAEG
jgi:hypothetical protein